MPKKIIFLCLTLCAVFLTHAMDNIIALDTLLIGAPYDWEPYLTKYPLTKIFEIIKRSDKNYASMADFDGNNLMLAFIKLHHKEYRKSDKKQPLTKEEIQQFINQKFDINFQNKKTGTTFLIKVISKGGRKGYIPLELIEWLIPLCEKSLNLKNNAGYTPLLMSYSNYDVMALLLKYNAVRSLPIKKGSDHHWNSKRSIVQLETMFGPALTTQGYIFDHEAKAFISYMYTYDAIISKEFIKDTFIKLIYNSKESVAFFNRAAICNDTKVLDYFTQNGNDQKNLLKILEHCCTWNRAGATHYALSNLNPNRSEICTQTEKNSVSKNCSKTSYAKLKENPALMKPFTKVYRYITQKFNSKRSPIAVQQQKNSEDATLEDALIKIYQWACNHPETGFTAWLFLEAFNKYLTFGNQKNTDENDFKKALITYQENYDIDFNFLKNVNM